jgi:hypothetical protein
MPINDVNNVILSQHPFVFRNDCGMAFVGGSEMFVRIDGNVFMKKGWRVIINPVRIKYGLYPGSGDWIGWTETVITPEMVGQKIAVFTSIEAKTLNDKMHRNQKLWKTNVQKAGGVALVYKETDYGIEATE